VLVEVHRAAVMVQQYTQKTEAAASTALGIWIAGEHSVRWEGEGEQWRDQAVRNVMWGNFYL